MNYQNAWMYVCGILCIYPAACFALGYWLARNAHRIDLSALKFWRRNRDR